MFKRAGIVVLTKVEPTSVFKIPYWYGHFIELTFPKFKLVCSYVPNPTSSDEHTDTRKYRTDIYRHLRYLKNTNEKFIWCGDLNLAPSKDIDSINVFMCDRGDWDKCTCIKLRWWKKMLLDTDAKDAFREINVHILGSPLRNLLRTKPCV